MSNTGDSCCRSYNPKDVTGAYNVFQESQTVDDIFCMIIVKRTKRRQEILKNTSSVVASY